MVGFEKEGEKCRSVKRGTCDGEEKSKGDARGGEKIAKDDIFNCLERKKIHSLVDLSIDSMKGYSFLPLLLRWVAARVMS